MQGADMKDLLTKIVPSIILLLLISGAMCKKNESPTEPEATKPPSSDIIVTGEPTPIKTELVGSGGGKIIISSDGPLNGLELSIPPNSYNNPKNFEISYAVVENHKLGQNYKISSPLIKIKNEGGYAEDYMTLKIPIKKESDEFAMGFFYDDQTGKLEGLPLIDISNSFVTVATRHFSSSSIQPEKRLGKTKDLNSFSNLIIVSVKESFLNNQSIISTGFTPGVDDWEFTNYGSYIAPGGHCAGQSISAMWYYYEKKLKGAPNLYRLYDKIYKNTGSGDVTWFDNKYGFRFASVVQEKLDWDGKLFKLLLKIETTPNYHFLSWRAFAMSMLLTGEPQFVGLTSNDGGHAIIAHKISLTENKLYVCDPNYPGQEKVITFNGNKFDNYITKQNADAPESNYWGIGYYSKTSMIDWDILNTFWTQFENKTIGNNDFPNIVMKYLFDKEWIDLKDTLTTTLDTLSISSVPSAGLIGIDENGNRLANPFKLHLEIGKNQFGFALFLKPPSNNNYKWVDFRWVTIERKASPYPKAIISFQAIDVNKNFILLSNGANLTTAGWTNKPPTEPLQQALVWFGNKFHVNYNYSYKVGSYMIVDYTGVISGEIDPVAKKIKRLNASVIANTDNGTSITTQSVLLEDIPIEINDSQINTQTTDGDIAKYVKDFQLNIRGTSSLGNYVWTLNSIDWSNAKLSLYLSK